MRFTGPPQLVYLALLWFGLRMPGGPLALGCALLLCLAGAWLWWRTLRQASALRDTPLARIASAAQGYVELRGALRPFAGSALTLPGSGMPCVWFRCEIQERVNREWRVVDRHTSEESLLLNDGSGECLVFWEDAEMLGLHQRTSYQGDQRISESWLAPGEQVTVVGELRTRSGDGSRAAIDDEVAGLLDAWKRDRPTLLRRFDRNGDGEIDLDEWEQVRREARATILRERGQQTAAADTHVIGKPASGRPFIISTLPGRGTGWRFRTLALLDVAAFLGGLWWLGRLLHAGLRA